MKDEFEPFEEDFDAEPAKYQFWLLGYDKNQNITDFEFLVNEANDPDPMIAQANQYLDEEKYKNRNFPQDVVYLEAIVETVVNIDDYDENVGTLFSRIIKIK